jgi:hypothetical protein
MVSIAPADHGGILTDRARFGARRSSRLSARWEEPFSYSRRAGVSYQPSKRPGAGRGGGDALTVPPGWVDDGGTALDPCANKPMRIVDLVLSACEHVDYHPPRIRQLARALDRRGAAAPLDEPVITRIKGEGSCWKDRTSSSGFSAKMTWRRF